LSAPRANNATAAATLAGETVAVSLSVLCKREIKVVVSLVCAPNMRVVELS
jgi:hypothetical protein